MMPNKNEDYWKKRFEIMNRASEKDGRAAYSQIESAFTAAQRDIQRDIDAWYARFAGNNGISLVEAKKLLNRRELDELKWDVDQYIQYGKANAIDGKWAKQLENASARFHITRLEALQIRTQQALEKAFGNELDAVDGLIRKTVTSDYYHTAFELQKGFRVGFDIGEINSRDLDKLVKKPWTADGRTFSDRIWGRKQQMIGDLNQELVRNCIYGRSQKDAIAALEKYVDKNIKNAKYCARRLVVTEQAYFSTLSQFDALRELGVEEYEIDLPTTGCEVCKAMNGRHFPMSAFEVGSTAPPFHPNCENGGIIPYFNDEFELEGKPIPEDISYEEWGKEFVRSAVENGLTNLGKRGIIKGQSLAAKKAFAFLDYELVSDSESVEKFRTFAAEQLDISHIQGIELLKNGDTALEIIESLKQLSEQYGKGFSRISVLDFGDSITVAETLTNELRLSSQFMNRPEALKAILDEWEAVGYIPKGCNDAAYVGTHEFFHLLTQDLINEPKSEIVTEVRRAIKSGTLPNSRNGKDNGIHEYVADLLAAKKLDPKQQLLVNKIMKILKSR